MIKKLTENFSIKMLSLVIAFVAWLIVTNIIDPMLSGFISVPVIIENEDYIFNQNKTFNILDSRVIRVNYKVKSTFQNSIRQNDFRVYVDLKEYDERGLLPVHIETQNGIENNISNIEPEPSSLRIELSDVSRSEFEVQYELSGNVSEGHGVGSVILSPNIVYVSGGSEAISKINKVSIDIPINNREETFSGVADVKILDSEGNEMSHDGYAFSASEINYSVVVDSSASVVLNAVIEGNVKEGHSLGGVQIAPNTIVINGPRSIVGNLYTLDLPTINIDGIEMDTEYAFTLSDFLPMGITSNTNLVIVHIIVNDVIYSSGANEEIGPHLESEQNMIETIVAVETETETSTETLETVEMTEAVETTETVEAIEATKMTEAVEKTETTETVVVTETEGPITS